MSARTLPIKHAGSPLRTNAAINRKHAIACFEAGMSPAAIAAEWPEVFKITIEDGGPRLGMKYDYELGDGSGRFETNRVITAASVRAAIARHKSRGTA